MTDNIFSIPDENMTALAERLDKLTKRARKTHTSPIGYEVIGQEVKAVNYRDTSLDASGELKTRDVVFHTVRVYGDIPYINGYMFIAAIDHVASDEGNVVNTVPGMCHENELISFRHVPPTCDHCHMSRKRNMTYVLRHVESGTYMRVGKNCLADFLRTTSAMDIAASLELLSELCAMCSSAEEYDDMACGSRRNYLPLEEYLWNVSASIREDGWISSGKAREQFDLVATKTRAMDSWQGYNKQLMYDVKPIDKERTEKALTWIRAIDTTSEVLNDYLYNLYTVCKGTVLSMRHTGIAASLFVAHDKAMNVVYEQSVKQESSHVGKQGDKLTVTVKVLSETPISGKYGTTYLYSMIEETSGNRFKWFSSNGDLEHSIHETVTLTGTVKAHETYNNVKSTVLTRCKVK